jgi:AcrR family transcriptional regulator
MQVFGEDMKEVKDNRGTRKTRNAIRNSLIELMKQKPIMQITVSEICEKADIHRTTFYAHYDNQYDLLKQIEQEVLTHYDEMLDEKKLSQHCTDQQIIAMAENLLHHIAINYNSVQVLLSKNGDIYFQEKLIGRVTMHFRQLRKKYIGDIADDQKNGYYSVFLVHGAIAIIQLWLKNDMDMPVTEIAQILLKFAQGSR